MKVGILTFHYSNYNFGAVLQTYSLYKYIESIGHTPYIIDYKPEYHSLKEKLINSLITMLGFRFELFRKKYIPNTLRWSKTEENLKELNQFLDAFIVGSDQVWRYKEDNDSIRTYFLDFVEDDKLKISYAASFGIDNWKGNERITNDISKLIKNFNAISVREDSGVKICNDVFHVEAIKVLDPTLLNNKKYFNELADSINQNKTSKYLAYMLLDEKKDDEEYFRRIANKNKLKFINIKGIHFYSNLFLYHSINKWLNYLKHSELVVTDSFHCVVFSLIFRKKFICLANTNRGITRLLNLLKMLSLEYLFYTSVDQINMDILWKAIDYKRIEKIIESKKTKSSAFLTNNLSHGIK